jgi:hypothetical protein
MASSPRSRPTTRKPVAVVPDVEPAKPWWRRTWALVSAAIGIIGAITGVVGVWPLLFRDATSLESLTISIASAESELAPVFAVPITVDWSTFPTSEATCDESQRSWLAANGTPLAQRFLVSVANVAAEGAMLSLKDFRGRGEVESVPVAHVAVTCDLSGAGESNIRSALLDPATGRTAVYVQPNPDLPDNPLVFNLAPGENGQFALLVRSSADFSGDLVFTEALGGQTREIVLPIDGIDGFIGTAPTRFTVTDGRLACVGDAPCAPADVLAALSAGIL